MNNLNQNFLFLLSAIGVFNGILVAIYFFLAKPRKLSNFFLGMMLLMLCIRIWKSIFFYFNPQLPTIFLQIGLSAYFFVGPFLYFFIVEHTQSQHKWMRWQYQLVLLSTFIIFINLYSPYQYPGDWVNFVIFIQYQWPLYILASIYIARKNLRKLFNAHYQFSNNDIWLISVLIGNAVIWIAYFSAPYTSYIFGSLTFSFVFYLLSLLLFFRRKEKDSKPVIKYADKQIPATQANPLIEKLNQLMVGDKLFQNANLTMPMVAKRLGVTTQSLSQLLNDNIQKSFTSYINEFRIMEAKKILLDSKAMKMDDIANECGFNSQSTFYSAFKKLTNTTPAKFRDDSLTQTTT